MGSSQKIAKGIAWTSFVNIINGVYGFISVPILIAYFGKSDYGLIGLAISVNVYLGLMDLGFNSTNIRFFSNWIAQDKYTQVNRLFRTSLTFYGVIGILNSLILIVIGTFSEYFFNFEYGQYVVLKHLFYILSISAFVSWYTSCFDQLIRSYELIGWTQKITLLPKFFQILILIFTVVFEFSIELYYGLTIFSMFLIIPFLIFKIKRICPYISFIPKFDKDIFKTVLPYSINIFSFGLFQFSVNYLRPVFLGVRGSMESVTDYRVLNGIVSIVLMLGGTFLSAILPSASKVVTLGDRLAQQKIIFQGTKYISIILCYCCFAIMCVSPELLVVYVGEEYLNLVFWLDIWLLTTLANHNQAISCLILSGSDIKAITYSTILSSIVGLVLCWILVAKFAVGGTVIAYAVYLLLQMCFYYLYYWPKVMKIDSKKVFKESFMPFVIIGLIGAVVFRSILLTSSVWNELVLKGTFFTVYYFVFIIIVSKKADRDFINGILKR